MKTKGQSYGLTASNPHCLEPIDGHLSTTVFFEPAPYALRKLLFINIVRKENRISMVEFDQAFSKLLHDRLAAPF